MLFGEILASVVVVGLSIWRGRMDVLLATEVASSACVASSASSLAEGHISPAPPEYDQAYAPCLQPYHTLSKLVVPSCCLSEPPVTSAAFLVSSVQHGRSYRGLPAASRRVS